MCYPWWHRAANWFSWALQEALFMVLHDTKSLIFFATYLPTYLSIYLSVFNLFFFFLTFAHKSCREAPGPPPGTRLPTSLLGKLQFQHFCWGGFPHRVLHVLSEPSCSSCLMLSHFQATPVPRL